MDQRPSCSTSRLGQRMPAALAAIGSMSTHQLGVYSARLAQLIDTSVRETMPPDQAALPPSWELVDVLDDQAWAASESAAAEGPQYPAMFALARAINALVFLQLGDSVECLAEATYEAVAALDEPVILALLADAETL